MYFVICKEEIKIDDDDELEFWELTIQNIFSSTHTYNPIHYVAKPRITRNNPYHRGLKSFNFKSL